MQGRRCVAGCFPGSRIRFAILIAVIASTFSAIILLRVLSSRTGTSTGALSDAASFSLLPEQASHVIPSGPHDILVHSISDHPRNAFEEHYYSIYRTHMIDRTQPPKYMLFRMKTHGLGNKLRTLSGAMVIAALTDRVLLVDSVVFSHLFDPPVVDGVVLDWNVSLARGVCDSSDPTISHTLSKAIKRSQYMPEFLDFHRKYANVTCLIASSSWGHDRQMITLNEDKYRSKVERLFGHPTSRYNWSKLVFDFLLRRPNQAFVKAGWEHMQRMGWSSSNKEHRVAVHFRSFVDLDEKDTNEIMKNQDKFWGCASRIVKEAMDDRRRLKTHIDGPLSSEGNLTVLFVSDNPRMKMEAKKRLELIPDIEIVDAGLSFAHTSGVNDMDAFLEWFLIGECKTVVTTGYSSYGMTAFFRPSLFPPFSEENKKRKKKRLFTVDGLSKSFFANNRNPECGEIIPKGYSDINIGFYDPLHKSKPFALISNANGNSMKVK